MNTNVDPIKVNALDTEAITKGQAEVKVDGAAETPKKKKGRGIASAQGTSRKTFDTKDVVPNVGLFLAHIDSIEVTKGLQKEDSKQVSFNGIEVPRLNITFASNEDSAQDRKYVSLSFNAVESNIDTIPGGKKVWLVDNVLNYLKHILDVYVLKGRELTEEEESLLTLPFEDFDEDGNYVMVEGEEVCAGYEILFNGFKQIMDTANKGGSSYKTADGKFKPVYIKLLRYIKDKNGDWTAIRNGSLTFPTFVNSGVIEAYKPNVIPSIRVDIVRECVSVRNDVKSNKSPNTPNVAGAGIPMGVPMGGNMMGAESGVVVDPTAGMPYADNGFDENPF